MPEPILSARVLARMQASAVAAMPQLGQIGSDSGAVLNNAGGRSAQASTWTWGSPIACRIWRQRDFAIEKPESGITTSEARYKLSLPAGTQITTRNRFKLQGGAVFEIAGVDTVHADAIQVLCDVKLVS